MLTLWNEWLALALIVFGAWLAMFIRLPRMRKQMLWVGIFTMPLGLTEPLFVPDYWSPPSLFNLAATTGFDIESLIFSFAVGGLAAAFYQVVSRYKHETTSMKARSKRSKQLFVYALAVPITIFLGLKLGTDLPAIYTGSIALFIGAIALISCRHDIGRKILAGGLLFAAFYFSAMILFGVIYPDAIGQYWNLSALSGAFVLGIPIEELMWAFTFGLFWSAIYEKLLWYRIR